MAKDRIIGMEVYLVGGAVRDELLGLPVTERDWCVVGATPGDMEAKGFRPVGKDFPVFLHPDTGEEYALARTERKTAAGYHGFLFHTSPDVSIEDDLKRRDLTINAMARDGDGQLIDPFDGRRDLDKRVLRHVSPAFREDPVRILRIAKFAARFAGLGFRVAEETLQLMRTMVEDREVDALVPDRVWKETESALLESNPRVFIEVLRDCGALKSIYPEIDRLFGVPQPEKWHPEIDTGLHTLMVLEQAALLSHSLPVRFAALVHDLGKGTTPKKFWPSHSGHEKRGARLVEKMADRLPLPIACRELGCLAAEYHAHVHRASELKASTVLRVLERVDAFRRPERFNEFLLACEADARGRTGFENREYPQADFFRAAAAAARDIDMDDVRRGEIEAALIRETVQKRRLGAVKALKKDYDPPK